MSDITIDNKIKTVNKKISLLDSIHYIEKKFFHSFNEKNKHQDLILPGNIIRLGYKIPEGEKDRVQYYEGIIISKKSRNISKTFKIRRTVQGVGVEQTFLFHSPKIVSINLKQTSKIRRAKLYFLRKLQGKSARLKTKN